MTPQEVIKTLEVAKAEVEWNYPMDYAIAIDEAIKAVERQIPKFVQCPKGFQGVRDTRYYCPSCNSLTRQHEAICHKCGQTVKYPKEVYLKEKNKIILDWSEEE